MSVSCKYNCGRAVNISYKILNRDFNIETQDQYNLILIEQGNLSMLINSERYIFPAPSIVALKENVSIESISSHMLLAKVISFNVSFLNVNITYDLINSGKYEEVAENYGFIPLNIFYERNKSFFGNIPLYAESFKQIQEQYLKFNQAISEQEDKRWSCRARLHLNVILELTHQLYLDYIDKRIASYDIKDPNVWVAILLDKIHSEYMNSLSLITLSEYIHINKTTVGINFKKITGFSVTDYIINYRIKCACYSLSTTAITLKEIALICGFKQEAYFIRQFTSKIGMTPTEYRKNCLRKRKKDFQ